MPIGFVKADLVEEIFTATVTDIEMVDVVEDMPDIERIDFTGQTEQTT